jgi:hypothetical protein
MACGAISESLAISGPSAALAPLLLAILAAIEPFQRLGCRKLSQVTKSQNQNSLAPSLLLNSTTSSGPAGEGPASANTGSDPLCPFAPTNGPRASNTLLVQRLAKAAFGRDNAPNHVAPLVRLVECSAAAKKALHCRSIPSSALKTRHARIERLRKRIQALRAWTRAAAIRSAEANFVERETAARRSAVLTTEAARF